MCFLAQLKYVSLPSMAYVTYLYYTRQTCLEIQQVKLHSYLLSFVGHIFYLQFG